MPAGTASSAAQLAATTRSPHGNLAIPCQNCHTAASWKPIRAIPEFDHNRTRYPLHGMHENVACVQCHTKPVFSNVGTKCADCHADIHRRQFGAACEQCHTVAGWNVSMQSIRNHDNRFPLMGAHATLDCEACHKSAAVGQFVGLSTQCYSCHAQTYQLATNPNHVASKFSITCEQCHAMDNWLNARFDHSAIGFPLTGAHASLQCAQCHVNNNFNITNATCVSCHLKDYQATTNPGHVALGFSQNCVQCHTTAAWIPANFNHSAVGFPLTGGHANLQCTQCHVNNNFSLTSTACVSCHMPDYNKAVSPVNHVQLGFPTTCQNCHDTVQWTNGKFDHSATGFALTGAHLTLQCAQCHINNNYSLTSANTACVSCHQADYNNAVSPVNHIQLGFPTTCDSCHDTVVWTDGKFNHATTGWALTGAHAALQCAQCHTNNNYKLTSTACVTCHLTDYNNAVTPVNHIQLGYPTTCDVCHDTVAWTDAFFNHNNTGFPLTGAHTTVPCAQCHVNNNYTTVPTDCYSCHKADYQSTSNPNHAAAGFPTTCQTCHTTASWAGATFNHTWFPINHGNSGGVCSVCHTNSSNYAVFQCTNCHTQTQTAQQHQGVKNYVWNSTNCYQCHATGQGGG